MNEGDRPVSEREVPVGWAPAEHGHASPPATLDAQHDLAQLEAIMQAIPDGVMVFDGRGVLLRMNPAAAEIWRRVEIPIPVGPPRDEDLAKLRLLDEDGKPLPLESWPAPRALRGETIHGLHLTFAVEGARPYRMLVSAAPIRDADGIITAAVLTFSDETEIRELAEARDDLVRMVSHDLRAPLSAIYGQAHLIRRAAGDAEKVVARAAAIERSCERMSGMIQDLVEVTLLEAGQLPLAPARVDVATLLPDIIDGMRGGLDVDRVRLEVQSPCPADLDPARFERIVVNLVSNALKYSSSDVQVLLTTEGGDVVLGVADRGIGISTEDQARVFERYYRARGERQPEGLGLGLYITRLLVEAQGGRIEVESQLGSGSTFRVRFPGVRGP